MTGYSEEDVTLVAKVLCDDTFGGHAYGDAVWADLAPGSEAHRLALADAAMVLDLMIPVVADRARRRLVSRLRADGDCAAAQAAERVANRFADDRVRRGGWPRPRQADSSPPGR